MRNNVLSIMDRVVANNNKFEELYGYPAVILFVSLILEYKDSSTEIITSREELSFKEQLNEVEIQVLKFTMHKKSILLTVLGNRIKFFSITNPQRIKEIAGVVIGNKSYTRPNYLRGWFESNIVRYVEDLSYYECVASVGLDSAEDGGVSAKTTIRLPEHYSENPQWMGQKIKEKIEELITSCFPPKQALVVAYYWEYNTETQRFKWNLEKTVNFPIYWRDDEITQQSTL